MKTKLAVTGMILVGIVACAHMGGMEEKEKIYGKNPPFIEKSFASDRLRPGDTWKIYILASDPDGDMDALIAVVSQPGKEAYPVSTTRIKAENSKDLSGYIYLNTGGPYGVSFLQNQELTVSIQIRDKAGHTSQPVSLSVLLLSGQGAKSPPAGIFKENELGPIMVTLQPPSGQKL